MPPVATREPATELLDRTRPCSVEAERAVLGAILLVPEVCDEVVLEVSAEDFYDHRTRVVFEHLVSMHNDGMRIDINLLMERLRAKGQLDEIGGMPFLFELADCVATASAAVDLAKIVREKATLRSLIHAAEEVLRESFDRSQVARDVLARAEERIFLIQDQRGGVEITTIEAALEAAYDRITARIKTGGGIVGVRTGFPDLDRKTAGLHGSELVILAARPSMGKTAFATNIAQHVAINEKVGVLFVSLEMSKLELAERIMCSIAGVNAHSLRNGFATPHDTKKLVKVCSAVADAPLYIDDTPSRNMFEIAATARRLKRRKTLGLVVIDYLQLIEPDNPRDQRQEQVAKIARRLKGMARELNVPVLCLAQLNRQSEATKDNRPRLSHLRESGAIEQDADVVMFVHREDYYQSRNADEPVDDATRGMAEIIIAKQRNGPIGEVPLLFHDKYVRFESRALESQDFGDAVYFDE